MVAAQKGHDVAFIEPPDDIRALQRGRTASWTHNLWAGGGSVEVIPRVKVTPRATLLPGHRGSVAAATNAMFLRQTLSRASSEDTAIVVSWPWDWGGIRRVPASRKVFDIGDDWGELMPGRRERFRRYYAQIAADADEIIVVSEELMDRFPGRTPLLIRNGVSTQMLSELQAETEARTMIYVGTLTPRFDADLMVEVLRMLPGWRLEIIGGCQYPGRETFPSPDLERLLHFDGRVRWHGPLPRGQVIPHLDRAAVAVIPNRAEHSRGQDSMKVYDYAARGRPIVSTKWFGQAAQDHPSDLLVADGPSEFAAAVVEAGGRPSCDAEARRVWAEGHTWDRKWPAWSTAVFGAGGEQAR
jgi:glycosyltransferase involved in cell wall biosynthesis